MKKMDQLVILKVYDFALEDMVVLIESRHFVP